MRVMRVPERWVPLFRRATELSVYAVLGTGATGAVAGAVFLGWFLYQRFGG